MIEQTVLKLGYLLLQKLNPAQQKFNRPQRQQKQHGQKNNYNSHNFEYLISLTICYHTQYAVDF